MSLFVSPSWTMSIATFAKHILGIVLHRAQKEMIWPHTLRTIAMVENTQPQGNWAEVDFPRQAMRTHPTSGSRANTDMTISFSVTTGCPQPTFFCLFDFFPEAFNEWLTWFSWLFRTWNIVIPCPLSLTSMRLFGIVIFLGCSARALFASLGFRIHGSCYLNAGFATRCQPSFLGALLVKISRWLWFTVMRAIRIGADFHRSSLSIVYHI